MAQKNSKIDAEDIDINKLIEDGEARHLKLKEQAESSVFKASEDKAFDFEIKQCQYHNF